VLVIPPERGGDIPGAQLLEGAALGRVDLAQVVAERLQRLRVTTDQGAHRAAATDRTQLPVITHNDHLGAGIPDMPGETEHVRVGFQDRNWPVSGQVIASFPRRQCRAFW
jgi:hypothetical protein